MNRVTQSPDTIGTSPPSCSAGPPWSGLVERIQSGDPSGLEELYAIFTNGIRFYLRRQLGPQDVDDRVHEAFLATTMSIRRGDLREPERLMGYVRTVVRRQVAAHIEGAVAARRKHIDLKLGPPLWDRRPDPERAVIAHQSSEVARRVLESLSKRDREVLVRFYIHEQTPAQICAALGLTGTQFRLLKSRAKERFGRLGRARLARSQHVRHAR
jgi:RNA polymerase sigma-70 factor, ECF subfamily